MTSLSPQTAAKSGANGRTRRTQEERRAETRGRLLEVAIQMLGDRGYSRFRIVDAAAMAGVSRGGQTHYFATKKELVEAAVEQVFDASVDTAKAESKRNFDGSVIDHALANSRSFLRSSAYRVSVNMLVSAGADSGLTHRIVEISRRTRPPIEGAWIDRLEHSGVDRDAAETALWTLWSVQRGIAIDELAGQGIGMTDGLMAFATDLVKAALVQKPA